MFVVCSKQSDLLQYTARKQLSHELSAEGAEKVSNYATMF